MNFVLPILYSLILAAVHFFNERIQIKQEYVRVRIISFIAGISVTYVFLNLLPEVYSGYLLFNRFIFVSLLGGFTLAHVTEKYIYQHSAPQTLRENLGGLHSLAFFVYHLFIGVILVNLDRVSKLDSVLFFLPVLFYSSVGLLSLEKIHPKVWEKPGVKFILSLSTLFGVLFADYFLNFQSVFNLLFGFVVGAFLYIVLIDFVPREAKGRPVYFALGVLIYTLILVSTYI